MASVLDTSLDLPLTIAREVGVLSDENWRVS